MNAPFKTARSTLAEVYPPFAEKMTAYRAVMDTDPDAAGKLFAEAQTIAKAFYAGAEHARGNR